MPPPFAPPPCALSRPSSVVVLLLHVRPTPWRPSQLLAPLCVRFVSCCVRIARPTCLIREACCTSLLCAFLFISVSFCLCSYTHAYMASFWCWQASYTVSCQQGGGSTRPYFLFSIFLFTHSSFFRERESSETILLFSDSGGSEVG